MAILGNSEYAFYCPICGEKMTQVKKAWIYIEVGLTTQFTGDIKAGRLIVCRDGHIIAIITGQPDRAITLNTPENQMIQKRRK